MTKDYVLHTIYFELTPYDFTCGVAIQPLYCFGHTKVVALDMGERLSKFKEDLQDWWSYDSGEESLRQFKLLLIKNGIPWFEEYGTPEGIIDFIQRDKSKEYGIRSFSSFNKNTYLGFSLLYVGRIQQGIKVLEDEINKGVSPQAAGSWREYNKKLLEIINIIKKEPAKTTVYLQEFVKENKQAIGLPL